MKTMTEDRRTGFYFTAKQFSALMGAILSVQIGINWFAAKSFVNEVVVGAVKTHNTEPEAHARALMTAQQERLETTRLLIVLQTKIDGLEQMIRTLAAQGVFDSKNGNGNGNGNGRR